MTASQYKNIIQWTLFLNKNSENNSKLTMVRKMFNNLGVAFPNADIDDCIKILNEGTYLGWRKCSAEEAQNFSNGGIPAIAINSSNIIVIVPDSSVDILTSNKEVVEMKNSNVKHITEISEQMIFFAYTY